MNSLRSKSVRRRPGDHRSPLRGETAVTVAGVPVIHWDPVLRDRRRPDRWLLRRRVGNFGDLLGPIIVSRLVADRGFVRPSGDQRRLLAVGSILQLGRPGDVVWGSGVNGYHLDDDYPAGSLDVRAVRGPVTRRFLQERGHEVPEVYGDPGLLLPEVWPQAREWAAVKSHELTVVPNLWEIEAYRQRHGDAVLSPRLPLEQVVRRIAASELVVGSSLHALIIAESLGVPARLVHPGSDPLIKYDDYYGSTGRTTSPVESVQEAVRVGGEVAPVWSAEALLAAFPHDLWSA